MKKPVKFGRGVENKYGHMEYTSKCGNYRIEALTFTLPTTSVGYKVSKKTDGQWVQVRPGRISHVADTLAEAKLWACFEVDPNYEG